MKVSPYPQCFNPFHFIFIQVQVFLKCMVISIKPFIFSQCLELILYFLLINWITFYVLSNYLMCGVQKFNFTCTLVILKFGKKNLFFFKPHIFSDASPYEALSINLCITNLNTSFYIQLTSKCYKC